MPRQEINGTVGNGEMVAYDATPKLGLARTSRMSGRELSRGSRGMDFESVSKMVGLAGVTYRDASYFKL